MVYIVNLQHVQHKNTVKFQKMFDISRAAFYKDKDNYSGIQNSNFIRYTVNRKESLGY